MATAGPAHEVATDNPAFETSDRPASPSFKWLSPAHIISSISAGDAPEGESRRLPTPVEGVTGRFAPKLNTLHLTGICYFAVSGGPYGFEEVVNSGGSIASIVGTLLLPLVWSVPIALMTAELATFLPETGGHIVWVEQGLGHDLGFFNSMLAIATSVTDNALYPIMFVDYFRAMFNSVNLNLGARWGIKIAVMFFCTALNIRGVDIVGDASVSFGILVMLPFVVMAVLGWTKERSGPFIPPVDYNWGSFLTVLMWNTSGFDSAGTCAAEVKNPSTTYPKAVGLSLILVMLTYLLPLFAALNVMPNANAWSDGSWVVAARLLSGDWLGDWVGVAALISSLGLLSTLLCTTSRLFYGVAASGYLPAFFTAQHPTYSTPHRMIIANALCSLLFSGLATFESTAQITTVFYAVSTILRFAALWRLRYTKPPSDSANARPFLIPGGGVGMAACCIPPIALSVFAVTQCDVPSLIVTACCFAIIVFAMVLRNRIWPSSGPAINGHNNTYIQFDDMDGDTPGADAHIAHGDDGRTASTQPVTLELSAATGTGHIAKAGKLGQPSSPDQDVFLIAANEPFEIGDEQ